MKNDMLIKIIKIMEKNEIKKKCYNKVATQLIFSLNCFPLELYILITLIFSLYLILLIL